jgi:hypothetical protein
MLSGWTYQSTVRLIYTGSHPAGKVLYLNIGPNHPIWGAVQPDGKDVRVTKTDDTLCNISADQWVYRKIAQIRVRIPSDTSVTTLKLQWGNSGATSVFNSANTLDLPQSTERGCIGCWTTFQDTSGPYTDATGTTGNLTKVGTLTARSSGDLGWNRQQRLRISQFASNLPDAVSAPTAANNIGIYTGGTGCVQTAAIAMPSNFTYKVWSFGNGETGDQASWYVDANNYWRIRGNGAGKYIFEKKISGTITSTYTTSNVFGGNSIRHFAFSMGAAGVQVWINGIRYYWNPTDTTMWASNQTAKMTLGGYDIGNGPGGSGGNFAGNTMVLVPTLHNVQLTAWEINCAVFLMQPYDNQAQIDGILNGAAIGGKWGTPVVAIDGHGYNGSTWYEQTGLGSTGTNATVGMVQECAVIQGMTSGLPNGTFHMFYHAGLNPGTICHATSNDRLTWTRDASNPVMTDGAGNTLAVSGFAYGDSFGVAYVLTSFVTGPLKVVFSQDGTTFTTPITLLTNQTNSTWGNAGFGNSFIIQGVGGVQAWIEANGVGGTSFQAGQWTGPNIFSLVPPSQYVDSGGTLKGTPAQSACLNFEPQSQTARSLAATGNLTINATASTLVRASGSWVTDSVGVNDQISITGFTNPGNNGQYRVTTVTSGTLTLANLGTCAITETAAATAKLSVQTDFCSGQILGGPFVYNSVDGSRWIWGHGDMSSSPSPASAFSIIYCRQTFDGVNFFFGPSDIVQLVRNDMILPETSGMFTGADQQADPWIECTKRPPVLFSEVYDNVAGRSMIIASAATVCSMEKVVRDTTRLDLGLNAVTLDQTFTQPTQQYANVFLLE